MQTDIWTWAKLKQQLNFNGCKLLVDAEGRDTTVLRSLITHCREMQQIKISEWPNVIQFETMDNCDNKIKSYNDESKVINTVEKEGYVLVHYSNYNNHLAYHMRVYVQSLWTGNNILPTSTTSTFHGFIATCANTNANIIAN